MVEHYKSIKVEFILRRIDEIFIRDFPVEEVYKEKLHYELISEVYQQQQCSEFEFINLQDIFESLSVALGNNLLSKNSQESQESCLQEFLKHCQAIERTFCPADLKTVQRILIKPSFIPNQNSHVAALIANLQTTYSLWRQQQEELTDNKLLIAENGIDWNLEINQLIKLTVEQNRQKILDLEKAIIELLHQLHLSISPLKKIFHYYCQRRVFLEVIDNNSICDRVLAILYHKQHEDKDLIVHCHDENLLELAGGFFYEELYSEIKTCQINRGVESFVDSQENCRDISVSAELPDNPLVGVNIIPQPSLSEIPVLNPQDIKVKAIELNPGSSVRFYNFKISHKPTGITATIASRHLPMYLAMRLLIAKIYSDRM